MPEMPPVSIPKKEEKPQRFNPIPQMPEPEIVPEEEIELPEEEITQEDIQDIEQQSSLEQRQIESLLDTKLQTDVQKKFGELFFTTKKIYELKQSEESFDIL
jgi:hypothetical protein